MPLYFFVWCCSLVWGLVHGRSAKEQLRGVELVDAMLLAEDAEDRELLYLKAVGYYRLRRYLDARATLKNVLKVRTIIHRKLCHGNYLMSQSRGLLTRNSTKKEELLNDVLYTKLAPQQFLDLFTLQMHPEFRQAESLLDAVNSAIAREGLIGVGAGAAILGVVGAIAIAALSKR